MSQQTKQYLSYIFTFAVYASMLSWKVAIVLMGGVAWHEYGHLWAAKRKGMETQGFYLFPFIGGAALTGERAKSYSDLAYIVLMGPIFGGALAALVLGVYFLTGWEFLGGAALWMLYINLFNLAPLSMLDGGQFLESIVYSKSQKLGLIVMSISTAVAIPVLWYFNPIISVIVAVMGGTKMYSEYQFYKVSQGLSTTMKISQKELDTYLFDRPTPMNDKSIFNYSFIFMLMVAVLGSLMYITLHHHVDMNSLFVK